MIHFTRYSKYIAFLTFLLFTSAMPQREDLNPGGLQFSSKQVYSGQRTSFTLFKEAKHISKSFNLKFNCQIYNQRLFGFVFRAIHVTSKASDPLMHMLFVPVQGNSNKCVFEFHLGNSEKTIPFEMDTLQLTNISFSVEALVKENLVRISCNGITRETAFNFPRDLNVNFIFGLYGENTDVAPMILQNVRLNLNNQQNYQWLLNELNGNIAHDNLNQVESEVSNPNWMHDKHYYWEKMFTLTADPMAGIVMDKDYRLLIINKDSMVVCLPYERKLQTINYAGSRPFDKDAFFAVYQAKNEMIIGYDFHFLKADDGSRQYSFYDPMLNTWTQPDSGKDQDQNHHHCIFWNNDTTRLITFGGYSYFHYYNSFRSFDFETNHWEELKPKGDVIFPRTHAAVNRSPYDNEYYIFGGFGNKEGIQSLEGRYFYDLYRFNPETRLLKKLWNINSPGFDFVPRGSLIFRPDVPLAYVLGSKPVEKSEIRLYQINLEEPDIKTVSDSIPVIFSDMSGNAFLFLNKFRNELYCVTRETTNHNYSAITVYRLMFPPSEIMQTAAQKKTKMPLQVIPVLIVAFIGILSVSFYYFRKKRPKMAIIPKEEIAVKFERKRSNAVWLLNDFRVFDKNGHDITYRFPTKIRHAFIVLFFETYYDQGIVSATFSEILWPSLDKNQQKNNRGVLLNNLRKIFEDLEGVNLQKDDSFWKLTFSDQVYVDFIAINKLMALPAHAQNKEMLLDYFNLGGLLVHETWEYADRFKDRYSESANEVLMEMNRIAFRMRNYLQCIEISDIVLTGFDFLSEPAMIYKIKSLHILKNSNKALSEFNKFRTNYSESISKAYHLSFEEVLNLPENFESHLR